MNTQQNDFWLYYDSLSGDLLSKTSRSLYISFKFLPPSIRPLICLFYLLGRVLDNIADDETIPLTLRLELIKQLGLFINKKACIEEIATKLPIVLSYVNNPTNYQLIEKLPTLLTWLTLMSEEDKNDITQMMKLVLTGDEFDLKLFIDNGEIHCIQSQEELFRYCYYQASGIAEIANHMMYRHIPNYSLEDEPQMQHLASEIGTAMQLINILRDIPRDILEGRCYLPEHELLMMNVNPAQIMEEPEKIIPLLNSLHNAALHCLDAGLDYVLAINYRRIRYGAIIALLISMATLVKLKDTRYIRLRQSVKVTRWQIRGIMIIGLLALISKRGIKAYYATIRHKAVTNANKI